MAKCLIYGSTRNASLLKKRAPDLEYVTANRLTSVIETFLKNPDLDTVICCGEDLDFTEMMTVMEKLHEINPCLNYAVFSAEMKEFPNGTAPHVILINSLDQWSRFKSDLKPNMRRQHRVHWPLQAHFHRKDSPLEKHWGAVVSISYSGCFIYKGDMPEYLVGDEISLSINFKEFSFFSEGRIVRVQKNSADNILPGIAVEFTGVSEQTRNCIEDIVNNKLFSYFLKELNINSEGAK